MKRPLFAPMGPHTIRAFVVSVPLAFFFFIISFGAVREFGRITSGNLQFSEAMAAVAGFSVLSLLVGGIMLIPTFILAIPLYKFLKAQIGISLWNCLIFAALCSAITPIPFFGRETFTGGGIGAVGLFFVVPGLIAGFIFHRIDQGFWFRKPREFDPADIF